MRTFVTLAVALSAAAVLLDPLLALLTGLPPGVPSLCGIGAALASIGVASSVS